MSSSKRTRLPLQIGIQALYSLAVASATLVPAGIALLATLFLLILKGGILVALMFSQGWVVALGIVIGEVTLFIRGINHLRLALRTRAADVFFDDEGLAIDGGRLHGTSIRWADCKEVREEAVDSTEDSKIARTRAIIIRTDDSRVDIAEAAEETELGSLHVLVDSVLARVHPDKQQPLPPEERPDLLRCPECSAPTAPADADATTCAFCSASVPIPDALREKLRATNEVLASSKVSASLLAKLLAQPSAHRAMMLSVLAGLPIAAMWLMALWFGISLYRHHGLRVSNVILLSTTAEVTIVAVYFLLRFWFVNRKALSVITLSFGAFPPAREGAPWTCRACSAPLPAARDGLLARCTYCGSDNVQGIDMRPRADGARKERATLETTFALREKERRTYAVRAAVALAVLPLSVWGFAHASHALTRESKLLVACDRGDLAKCIELGHYYVEVKTYNHDGAKRAFDRACTRGNLDACADLGELLGKGDDKDLASALELLTRTCDRNNAAACGKLGQVIYTRQPTGQWPAPPTLFRRACDGGDAFGCTALGELLLRGDGVGKDEATAAKLFDQSCNANSAAACSDLAALYLDGRVVKQDVSRAITMLQKGCQGDYPASYQSCALLALAYHKGLGVPKDQTRSWDLDRRACEYGNIGASCTRIAASLPSTEYDSIREHYQTGCALGDSDGCIGLAQVLKERGKRSEAFGVLSHSCLDRQMRETCAIAGVWAKKGEHGSEADPKKGAELYAAGCKLDDKDSCNLGGQLAYELEDYATALPLLARACDLGEASGCNYLAKAQQDGLGATADETKALATFQRSCDMPVGDDGKHGAQSYGCAGAGFLAQKLGDASRANALLKKGCDWGNQEACDALAPPSPAAAPK